MQDIDGRGLISAASLLFAPGGRPGADAVAAFAQSHSGFAVSLDPAEDSAGGGDPSGHWLELIANGLTFDLVGLAPGGAAELPPRLHAFGFAEPIDDEPFEAITLRPGPHLAGGERMQPVIRSLAWLAAQLAELPGTRAVAWHAARSWCGPEHYRDSVLRWLSGGAFPGFGLAALVPMPDGGLRSDGLALFHGQELRLEPELTEDRTAAAKLALRLMHWLVEHGELKATERLPGSNGEPLRLEPSSNGRFVRVWRG